jgi:DNA polymerase-3 subunit alpha
LTYHTAFLKANYPVEFMSAVLSNEISNTDKIAVFTSDCATLKIKILPPDVNRSGLVFQPERTNARRAIRYGLAAIKNVGEGPMRLALAEREAGGPFKSPEDFATRLDARSCNKRVLESLIRAGAFDFTGEGRASMFARVDTIIASASSTQKDREAGQGSLFDMMDLAAAVPARPPAGGAEGTPVVVAPWTQEQLLADEKELLGFYVSGHPLEPWRDVLDGDKFSRLGQIEELEMARKNKEGWWEGPRYSFGVLIQDVDQRFSKTSGNPFAIVRIEDFTGGLETMIVGKSYERVQGAGVLHKGTVVEVVARVEHDDRTDSRRLSVLDIKALTQPRAARKSAKDGSAPAKAGARGQRKEPVSLVELHIAENSSLDDLQALRGILASHAGSTPFVLICRYRQHDVRLEPSAGRGVNFSAQARSELEPWLSQA